MTTSDFVYLDYAAATPLSEKVDEAMRPYLTDKFFNPSSPYAPAVAVRREYDDAKQRLAETFGAKGNELIMTAGATESVNIAFGATTGHVVTSAIEHAAVLETAKSREHTLVYPNENGIVPVEEVIRVITPATTFVSIGLANSELGTIQPIRKIAAQLQAIRQQRLADGSKTPLLFHTDASQGFGLVDIHIGRLGVDMLTLNAAKIYGPKQVGLLWAAPSVPLTPYIQGGGQEKGIRSGTENVAGTIGFCEAARIAAESREHEAKRLAELRDVLETKLTDAYPDAVVTGSKKHRLVGHLHISFPGLDAERLIFKLEQKHVYVATGSACAANKHTASHVLKALKLDDDTINGSLRITLGRDTTAEKLEYAAEQIIQAVREEKERLAK